MNTDGLGASLKTGVVLVSMILFGTELMARGPKSARTYLSPGGPVRVVPVAPDGSLDRGRFGGGGYAQLGARFEKLQVVRQPYQQRSSRRFAGLQDLRLVLDVSIVNLGKVRQGRGAAIVGAELAPVEQAAQIDRWGISGTRLNLALRRGGINAPVAHFRSRSIPIPPLAPGQRVRLRLHLGTPGNPVHDLNLGGFMRSVLRFSIRDAKGDLHLAVPLWRTLATRLKGF